MELQSELQLVLQVKKNILLDLLFWILSREDKRIVTDL